MDQRERCPRCNLDKPIADDFPALCQDCWDEVTQIAVAYIESALASEEFNSTEDFMEEVMQAVGYESEAQL